MITRFDRGSDSLIIASERSGGLLGLIRRREVISLAGTEVVHERYTGRRLRSRQTYHLLHMHGLEVSTMSRDGFRRDTPALHGEAIRFFYDGRELWFGNTLDCNEQRRAVDALLDYDAELRRSLGMNPSKGLADTSIWQSPATRERMDQEYRGEHMLIR